MLILKPLNSSFLATSNLKINLLNGTWAVLRHPLKNKVTNAVIKGHNSAQIFHVCHTYLGFMYFSSEEVLIPLKLLCLNSRGGCKLENTTLSQCSTPVLTSHVFTVCRSLQPGVNSSRINNWTVDITRVCRCYRGPGSDLYCTVQFCLLTMTEKNISK